MSADPNITSNVNRRARGDSHPSLTPLNGPDRRLPRITSGSTRHAATRSGRVASASTSGSSANTDDRVNASGVLATSPVDVRMHAPDVLPPSSTEEVSVSDSTSSFPSGVVFSPAVESQVSASLPPGQDGVEGDLLTASRSLPSSAGTSGPRVVERRQDKGFCPPPPLTTATPDPQDLELSSTASENSSQRHPAMIASSIAEAESFFLDGGSSPVVLTTDDVPSHDPDIVHQSSGGVPEFSAGMKRLASTACVPSDGEDYASDGSSGGSSDSTSSLGRILQTIRRDDRHGITPDNGPTLHASTRDGDDPLPPAQAAREQAPPTAMEAVLLRMGVLQLNADGLRVINPAAASADTLENLFVECHEAQRPPIAIGAVALTDAPRNPPPAPPAREVLPIQRVDFDSDSALHHKAVMANPLQYGDSGVERQREIDKDFRMFKAERDARLSATGPSPPAGHRVTFNANNTVPGTFPLPAIPTGTRAVPSRVPDASWVDEVSILRNARGASSSPGIFDHVPLPTNPYSVTAAVAAAHYDRDGIARHGFEPYADGGMTPAVSRDPYRRQGDMFSHLSPSGPQELWDEAIRHQQSLNADVGASTVASPLSASRSSKEPDRPYTPAAHRPARHARSSLVSVADPTKISRDRAQDAVYATATGTVPLPIGPPTPVSGEESPSPVADTRLRDGENTGASYCSSTPSRTRPGGANEAGPAPTYALVGGLPYVEGTAVRMESYHHRRFPPPPAATFTSEDVARACGDGSQQYPALLSSSEEAEHRAIIRRAMDRATAQGWNGHASHPELGDHSEMERDLQQLQMRRIFRDAKSSSDKRRLMVLGIYPDGTVDDSNTGSAGGRRAGRHGGWLPSTASPLDVPPPPTWPASAPAPPVNVVQSSSSSTLGAKLVGELSKLDTFSDKPTDWLEFKDAIFRVAGVNDLEHVLAPGYYQDPRFNARDNKLMYFLLQRAVTGTVDAIMHFRKAPAMDGHAAYFELYNAYTLAAPAQAAILLQKLTLFRMASGERLSAFCSRLVKLFDDLDRLPGEYRMTHNPTQRLGYLLTAIRNEADLKETYVYIEQAMTRGDMTFDLAVRALEQRCETLQAARALEDGAGGRRQGFAAVHGGDDSDSGTALFTSANKRHNGGNATPSTDFQDGTACLVKDCATLCLMPICPIHYAEMVCGKSPRLPLKRNWGEATYDTQNRRTIFPAAVPDDFKKRVKGSTKRTRTRGPKRE